MTFSTLGLSEQLLRAVQDSGYTQPTPIQVQAIPAILAGSDIMGAAQTGTGKTAGFTLPMLQLLTLNQNGRTGRPRALVLTPTRELAAQVQDDVRTYGKYLQLRSTAVFGGVNINPQIKQLRSGIDILVATPGRLLDLAQQNAVRFNDIEILVLDEADRMLDMGFLPDIKRIIAKLPARRQNLMFSATFSNEIRQLAKSITNNPIEIDVAPRNVMVDTVTHKIHPVDKAQKSALLSHLIQTRNWFQALVFSRTKHGADKLVKRLARDNIHAVALHGNKSQAQRTRIMTDFKKNKIQILVATDIAARGLDIDQLSHVVNFDLPYVPEDYIHRIGRTGRAGASGQAISLVSSDEHKQLRDIEQLIKRKLEREHIADFKPGAVVPEDVPARTENKPRSARNKGHNASQKHSQKRSFNGQDTRSANGRQQGRKIRSNKPGGRSAAWA
ncbi:MAG: rhlE [Gammaproteobacteria bacterium]|nr:rhlE [Gammaproteobacteria bacterium]